MTDNVSTRVPMVATARQLYEGRSLRAGESFDVQSEQDAEDLVAVGFAVRVDSKIAEIKKLSKNNKYLTRQMKAK